MLLGLDVWVREQKDQISWLKQLGDGKDQRAGRIMGLGRKDKYGLRHGFEMF